MKLTKFGSIPSEGDNWLSPWLYAKKITIPASKIDADLTNFPISVYLNNTNFDFSKCKADGSDIRFTDKALNQLKFERKEHVYVAGGISFATYNVQVPTVSNTTDTEIYMWYGNASAYNTSIEAWQDQTGKALTYNGNVKLVTGVESGKRVASFDGSGDYFSLASSSDLDIVAGNFTHEMKVKFASVSSIQLLYDARSSVNGYGYSLSFNAGSIYAQFTSTWISTTGITFVVGTVYDIVCIKNGTSISIYVDGILRGSNASVTTNGVAIANYIGKDINREPDAYDFNGSIYGIRITKGRARYTTTFTPPTTFTIDGSDVVLCTNFDTIYDQNYALVNHMGDSLVDATGNGNNGTATGTTVVNTDYGKARSFNGSSDYITTLAKANASEGTIMLLNNPLDGTTGDQWLCDDGAGYYGIGYVTGTNAQFSVYDTTSRIAVSTSPEKNGFNTFTGRYKTGEALSLTVGTTKYTGPITANIGSVATALKFGKNGTYYPLMILAGARLSSIARSDAWIKAESLALKNNLFTVENIAEVLADVIVTSATTSINITGLNIGKNDEIMLVSDVVNTTGDSINSIYVNNNTTATNYYTQELSAINTAVSGARTNSSKMSVCLNANSKTDNICAIKLTNSGYSIFQSNVIRNVGTSSMDLKNYYGTSTFTATSITQITITNSTASGIDVGSRLTLYKIGRGI